jgi:hypothetical protein
MQITYSTTFYFILKFPLCCFYNEQVFFKYIVLRIKINPVKAQQLYSVIFKYMFQPKRPSSGWTQEWKNIYAQFI